MKDPTVPVRSGGSGAYERRSIVLVLEEAAQKTPEGQPILVTAAEAQAWKRFLDTRGIKMAPTYLEFQGRRLLVIDEALVLPQLEVDRATMRGVTTRQVVRRLVVVGREMVGAPPATDGERALLEETMKAMDPDQLEAFREELDAKLSAALNRPQAAAELLGTYGGIQRSNVPMFSSEVAGGGKALSIQDLKDARSVYLEMQAAGKGAVNRLAEVPEDLRNALAADRRALQEKLAQANGVRMSGAQQEAFAAAFASGYNGADDNDFYPPRRPEPPPAKLIPVGVPRGYFEE